MKHLSGAKTVNLSQAANWGIWPLLEIHAANSTSLCYAHHFPGSRGQQSGPNRTTLTVPTVCLLAGSPSGKTNQGHRSFPWLSTPYRLSWFLELSWLTGPVNSPNQSFSPKEAKSSQRRFQVYVWWSPGFLMVIVVKVQEMNITEMHLVAQSFKSNQRFMGQDRAQMTEGGMILLMTARTANTRGDENLHARPEPQ